MTTKTVRMKASQITKDWHVIDAADRPLGRVATEVATLLRGKHKPNFEPHLDMGDFVIVINASKVRLSGGKSAQKKYYWHSGYPGGLKVRSFEEQLARHPERVIEQAVWGMLPNGSLGKKMLKHLKVYPGPDHPHQSQVIGSERAREAREKAAAEALYEPRKPVRLRPLPVPQGTEEPEATTAAPATAAEEEPATPAAEAPEATAAETEVPAAEAEAPAEAGATEPKKSRRRAAKSESESEE